MKLNKRFLILLLLLFILILGFNSVGAADLSESGDDGTADLSLDDDLIMETTDSLPASNMDALDEGQDSIQVLNNDAFNELQSKIRRVVSPLMGSFDAELTINYESNTPDSIIVRIQIVEVPGEDSNIPGEKRFKIPEDKLETEEHKQERLKAKESKKDVNYLVRKAKEENAEET